jgi:hypothetical protein
MLALPSMLHVANAVSTAYLMAINLIQNTYLGNDYGH